MPNILFFGDVVGSAGRSMIKKHLPSLKEKYRADFVIANGENAAGGFGITKETFLDLASAGINCVTTGNHIWDKKEVSEYIASDDRLLRPANLPQGNPGSRYGIYNFLYGGKNFSIGVFCLNGRIFLPPAECPFRAADEIIAEIRKKTPLVIVDIHAEATSEKQALGYYLDGKATAVIGTHTHVQTADEKVLPGGTAYITDAGMCGGFDSVLGVKKELIIRRFLTQMPEKFETSKGDPGINCVAITADESTGRASSIERIRIMESSGA